MHAIDRAKKLLHIRLDRMKPNEEILYEKIDSISEIKEKKV